MPVRTKTVSAPVKTKRRLFKNPDPEPATKRAEPVAPPAQAKVQKTWTQTGGEIVPPQLPKPTFFRQMLSALIDEMFVFTLWAFSVVITLKFFTGSFIGLTAQPSSILQNPQFVHLAMLEFGAIWICYFAFCIGLLDMTFGMWVWGLRVGYRTESRFFAMIKKGIRIGLSVVIYLPILPLLLLSLVGKNRRNILDTLSGTNVYQAAT